MTAHSQSKTELLSQSLGRLYPERSSLVLKLFRPDEMSRALRLQRQYEKTLQKRSRHINQSRKPRFRSLTKNLSCHNAKIRDSKKTLACHPYHSMNVDHYNSRTFSKPLVRWDSRMYVKPTRTDHLATRTQTVTLNTTESYRRIEAMMNNMYRPSVKDFFGEQYNIQTGLDPEYVSIKKKKGPIIL